MKDLFVGSGSVPEGTVEKELPGPHNVFAKRETHSASEEESGFAVLKMTQISLMKSKMKSVLPASVYQFAKLLEDTDRCFGDD